MKPFYIGEEGSQPQGPFDEEHVRQQCCCAAYKEGTLVWTPGMPEWVPLATLFPEAGHALPAAGAGCPALPRREFSQPFTAFAWCCRHAADFEGRASRREFWMGTLGIVLVGVLLAVLIIALGVIAGFALGDEAVDWVSSIGAIAIMLYGLFAFVLNMSMTCRRLHDLGQSGLLQFLHILLFPFSNITFLVLCCLRGQPGVNKYGVNPDLL